MSIVSAPQWDAFLSAYPHAHLLQTSPWGLHKRLFGWEPYWVIGDGESSQFGAQVLFRRLPLGLHFAYIPKGPVGMCADNVLSAMDSLLPAIDSLCHQKHAVFLKIEPDLWEDALVGFVPSGFQSSQHSIQPQRTLLVDISGDEPDVLAHMKQKTRYNIRLAEKKGVSVHPSADVPAFHRLMQTTGERDAFGIHSLDYYQQAYDLFHPLGMCALLLAEYQGELLAGLMVFAHGSRAWYLYGASSNQHRELMANYLLQWEAIRWARQQGCTEYDLWGVPDESEDRLGAGFAARSDGLWGVYRFKRGFGGTLKRSAGPWDRVYNSPLYALYRRFAERRQI